MFTHAKDPIRENKLGNVFLRTSLGKLGTKLKVFLRSSLYSLVTADHYTVCNFVIPFAPWNLMYGS